MPCLASSTDVFVIGGGPAGLAAAIAARQLGFHVILADAATPPIDKACGEGIMPDGVAAARSLGIDLDTSDAQPFRGIRFCDGAHSVQAAFPHGMGCGIRRTALHRIMEKRAIEVGVQLRWGVRVDAIENGAVRVGGALVHTRWIVGADGGRSRVRQWAGLDRSTRNTQRYGFRRHYAIAPWSDYMEIHWAPAAQLYITPVSPNEICVALVSRDLHLRLDQALPLFPAAAQRLRGVEPVGVERGGVSASRRLKAVCRGQVALVGDASGSVDAITGDGLCLLFQQSAALASAFECGDLSHYQAEHSKQMRRPEFMAKLMLMLDGRGWLQRCAMGMMAFEPRFFAWALAAHVGATG